MKENKARWINRVLTVYSLFSRKLKKHQPLQASQEFQRIAIYSTTALGDLMFNTPAIAALKARYPAAELLLVSSEKNRPLVAESPWFKRVLYWDNKIRNAWPLIKDLRAFRPQLTVILHSYMPYDILCAVLSGSEYIVRDCYRVDSPRLNGWLNAYSGAFEGHLIQRKLNLLSVLGCRSDDIRMQIPVSWQHASPVAGVKRIGFQMGASEEKRCWPVSRFVELARELTARPGYQVVLIGGGKDKPLVQKFAELAGETLFAQVENQVAKTSLSELLTLIEGFDVLVTGDTGPLHLAVALQTATVSLYADAEPRHTGPYQDSERHKIIKAEGIFAGVAQPLEQVSTACVSEAVYALTEK